MARSPFPEAASAPAHSAACLVCLVAVTAVAPCLMPGSFACLPPGASDSFVERALLELPDRSPRASRRQDCAPRAAASARYHPPRSPRLANVAAEGAGDQPGELRIDSSRDQRAGA